MNIENLHKLYLIDGLVDTDTRYIRENSLFFALKGDNFNGNKFAEEALKKGAKYAIVDEVEYKTSENIILVNDVLETLQELANFHRNKLKIPIIALTGSNGKTTTKELINAVLSTTYKTSATKGNLNNHIGVPLTLLSMTAATEIGIVEMGANHHHEIEFLSKIASPDYGYITNFGSAHLEGFGSLEGVVKAKSEMYEYLSNNNKKVFVNPTDTTQVEKTKDLQTVFFAKDVRFIDANPFVKLSFKNIEIQSNLIGAYNFSNIAAAITIGHYFKISEEKIKEAIENYTSSNNRSQIVKTARNTIVLDAYNANPTSMKAALDSFKNLKDVKKVVVLGDMFELGDFSFSAHQKIVDTVCNYDFDNAFFIGKQFYKSRRTNHRFKSFEDFQIYLTENPIKDSTILIKGSRGMKLERTIDFC